MFLFICLLSVKDNAVSFSPRQRGKDLQPLYHLSHLYIHLHVPSRYRLLLTMNHSFFDRQVDFNHVAAATNLKIPAARMRYSRLKKQLEPELVDGKFDLTKGTVEASDPVEAAASAAPDESSAAETAATTAAGTAASPAKKKRGGKRKKTVADEDDA